MPVPSGTVTFLFTDMEGSTRLAREHADRWDGLRARHHQILREAIEQNHGYVFQIIGDAFCAAFHTPADALHAAVLSQHKLQAEAWGETLVRVRMGIHTGEAQFDGQDYNGYLTLSMVQRLMSAGHGGQVLVSGAAENILRGHLPGEVYLQEMGRHFFKDVPQPVRLFQVKAPGLQKDFPPVRTIDHHPNNLPAQLTSFVGREKERAEIRRLLQNTQMLTLIGPGGTGKTRLSLQAAREMMDAYPDGVWFVELAPILDPLLVPRTAASAIGLQNEPLRPVIEMLCEYLRDQRTLLVLDNCEHLVDACAHMADHILHAAPEVSILASSREALGIGGEVTYRVPSLGLPDITHLPPVETLNQYEAVRLFIDRATSADPSFIVTNQNAPAVAQICHRLDGIPLAIELAAAKIRVLSVDQIARRLDDRFKLLTGGSRTALERHQTLRAAIDWSYNLLPPSEQILFRRLSIFVDGWTLEAAEFVCSDPQITTDEVLDLMDHLIHKSLAFREDNRYRMLETIRQYANEKLVDSGESETLRHRHLEFFLDLAETARLYIRKTEQIRWLPLLDAEQENFRAALEWSLNQYSAESALRLTGSLGAYWEIRSQMLEGTKWTESVLVKDWNPHSSLEKLGRARTLYWRAKFGNMLDDLQGMGTSAALAVKLWEEIGDLSGLAYARSVVANHLWRVGDYHASQTLFEQCLADFQKLQDPWGESYIWSRLSTVAGSQGDFSHLLEFQEKALDCARTCGDRDRILLSLGNIAFELLYLGNYDRVQSLLQEAEQSLDAIGSTYGYGRICVLRTHYLLACGNPDEAKEEIESLVDFSYRTGDRNLQGTSLFMLALISERDGNIDLAIEQIHKALQLYRQVGAPENIPTALIFLSRLNYQLGNRDSAVRYTRESLEAIKASQLGDDIYSTLFCQISGMLCEKKPRVAVQLLGYTEVFWQTTVYPRDFMFDLPYYERFRSMAESELNELEYASAWEAGLVMSREEACTLALRAVEEL